LLKSAPCNLLDSEELEADYHDQKSQLNEQRVRDRHVWGKKLNAGKKSRSGSTPTRRNLEGPKQVRRGHDEEGEADSLAQVRPATRSPGTYQSWTPTRSPGAARRQQEATWRAQIS
jgi:hypothetical protein